MHSGPHPTGGHSHGSLPDSRAFDIGVQSAGEGLRGGPGTVPAQTAILKEIAMFVITKQAGRAKAQKASRKIAVRELKKRPGASTVESPKASEGCCCAGCCCGPVGPIRPIDV